MLLQCNTDFKIVFLQSALSVLWRTWTLLCKMEIFFFFYGSRKLLYVLLSLKAVMCFKSSSTKWPTEYFIVGKIVQLHELEGHFIFLTIRGISHCVVNPCLPLKAVFHKNFFFSLHVYDKATLLL